MIGSEFINKIGSTLLCPPQIDCLMAVTFSESFCAREIGSYIRLQLYLTQTIHVYKEQKTQ